MKLGKTLGRLGFVIGFVGPLFFYASPVSWPTYESHLLCPWCPYVDIWSNNWLDWTELGLTTGLASGLLLALVGFCTGIS